LLLLLPAGSVQAEPDLFRDRVAPLLQERCLSCHGPEKKRGGLDLSTRAGVLAGGDSGPALVPGAAQRSRLLQMVSSPGAKMPRTGPKLTAGEVALVREWIDNGARWPGEVVLKEKPASEQETWWSLQPLRRPVLPRVKANGWQHNPVDVFLLASLEKYGLSPSPEADRRTLLRRVTFDLTGLPPTPEEIEAFLNDRTADAWEKVVDRLLASPAYGERWGRHWLDLVHYGDTHGYDKDKRRDHAWPYRDYVVRAFNNDKPYSRFVREQLAGDVLFPADPDGVPASGFVVAGPWDFVGHVELREGTVDKEKTRSLDRDDMVSSTITTFLSLTVGCARCHDHKFDPIPQKDYYRLQAVFAGVERGNRPWPAGPRSPARDLLEAERVRLLARQAELNRWIQSRSGPELTRIAADLAEVRRALAALPAPAGAPSPSNGYHSGIASRVDVVKWVQVDLGKSHPLDTVRLIPARPTDFRDSPGFGFPVRFRIELADEPAFLEPIVVADHTAADFVNPGDTPYVAALKGQRARYVRVTATRLWKRLEDYVFALAELQVESGGRNLARGAAVASLDSIEAGRWSRRYLVDDFDSRRRLPDLSDAATNLVERRRHDLVTRLSELQSTQRAELDKLAGQEKTAELARIEARLSQVDAALRALPPPAVYALVARPPRPIHILHRGEVEQPRALVQPGGLACVRGPSPDFVLADPGAEGSRRAALAEWITHPDNPLTWRSIVNRVWQYHFGRGLVDTPSDFGRNGSRPSHPELLDWLAVEFRDGGGSLKKLHRLLVTSAAYRQSSNQRPDGTRLDADNRLLWRMNRTRLDAEALRDSVLTVSGRLDRRMGGAGFELFRFRDDHSPEYDHSDLARIHDPAGYRRTVYRFTVRSVPNPFLDALDCADPNLNTPVRNTTLTALQALALLNNPFMIRQSEYFAQRLQGLTGEPAQQIALAFCLALGRAPDPEEQRTLLEHARRHGLPAACRVLFNLNEFVFVD
jgi:hypothetical protein